MGRTKKIWVNFFNYALIRVTYGDGLFMLVGDDRVTYVSTDGINWQWRPGVYLMWECCNYRNGFNSCIPAYGPVLSVAYGNGRFLLSGEGLAQYKDGGWEILKFCQNMGRTIFYDGTRFVMFGLDAGGVYFTEDGKAFEQISTAKIGAGSMAYNGSVYVIVRGITIETLSQNTSSVTNFKRNAKLVSGFTMRQNGRMLKITMPKQSVRPQIALFDIAGRRQKMAPFFHADGTVSVLLPDLAAGMYIVRVESRKDHWQKRVIFK